MQIVHTNKMHLRGCPLPARSMSAISRFSRRDAAHRVALSQGHAFVLVSGTLDILARQAALALVLRLAIRETAAKIRSLSRRAPTQIDGRYTGKISGEAIYAEGKA